MAESHATKQMRAAIIRVEKAVAEAQRVAQGIEASDDADERSELCGMAVSILNLLIGATHTSPDNSADAGMKKCARKVGP